jgi:hypothetical protein
MIQSFPEMVIENKDALASRHRFCDEMGRPIMNENNQP